MGGHGKPQTTYDPCSSYSTGREAIDQRRGWRGGVVEDQKEGVSSRSRSLMFFRINQSTAACCLQRAVEYLCKRRFPRFFRSFRGILCCRGALAKRCSPVSSGAFMLFSNNCILCIYKASKIFPCFIFVEHLCKRSSPRFFRPSRGVIC